MIKYSTMVHIARPPATVLAALLDGPRYEKWTEMVDSRFEGPGEPRVGTRGSFRFDSGPLKGRYEMEITRLERDRRLDVRITGDKLAWESSTELAAANAGTDMTYAGELRLLGWRRLLEPVFAGEVRKAEAKEAERLRDLLEAEAVDGGATR